MRAAERKGVFVYVLAKKGDGVYLDANRIYLKECVFHFFPQGQVALDT